MPAFQRHRLSSLRKPAAAAAAGPAQHQPANQLAHLSRRRYRRAPNRGSFNSSNFRRGPLSNKPLARAHATPARVGIMVHRSWIPACAERHGSPQRHHGRRLQRLPRPPRPRRAFELVQPGPRGCASATAQDGQSHHRFCDQKNGSISSAMPIMGPIRRYLADRARLRGITAVNPCPATADHLPRRVSPAPLPLLYNPDATSSVIMWHSRPRLCGCYNRDK